jgi:hypothetical protein
MVMETLCDRIAQRLLLPSQVVDAVVGRSANRSPSARAVQIQPGEPAGLRHDSRWQLAHLALAARAREDPGRVLGGRSAGLRFAERLDELAAFAAGQHVPAGTDAVWVSAAFGRTAPDLMAHIEVV